MRASILLQFSIVSVLLSSGCSNESTTPAPESDTVEIADVVTEIVDLRDQIRDGFANGDVDAAHGPLHDVGDRLETLSAVAGQSGLSAEDKDAVEDCVNTLFAAFGEVDKTLHGQEGSTYEEEAATIDETLEKLDSLCKTHE